MSDGLLYDFIICNEEDCRCYFVTEKISTQFVEEEDCPHLYTTAAQSDILTVLKEYVSNNITGEEDRGLAFIYNCSIPVVIALISAT